VQANQRPCTNQNQSLYYTVHSKNKLTQIRYSCALHLNKRCTWLLSTRAPNLHTAQLNVLHAHSVVCICTYIDIHFTLVDNCK